MLFPAGSFNNDELSRSVETALTQTRAQAVPAASDITRGAGRLNENAACQGRHTQAEWHGRPTDAPCQKEAIHVIPNDPQTTDEYQNQGYTQPPSYYLRRLPSQRTTDPQAKEHHSDTCRNQF